MFPKFRWPVRNCFLVLFLPTRLPHVLSNVPHFVARSCPICSLILFAVVCLLHFSNKNKKQDAAHEPECSHVEHFCETNYLNSLVHFSPVTVPVHSRPWNAEEGGVQSVECGV